ncbi:MAG: transporter substrate-binding domain-containing protein [Pseudomonadales bacterium]|nr:transporter substrate-binding domain-containing protein [Pseudomonadales bacterium]
MSDKVISSWTFGAFIKRLLVLMCLSWATQIYAKALVVGVEDIEYFPIYAKRGGQYAGFARDFLDAFALRYGHAMTYKPMPIKRLYGEFLNGRVDLKFPDDKNWASDKKAGKGVVYSAGVLEYIDGVMVAPGELSKGENSLKILGTVRGFTPWDYMDQISSGSMKIKENSDLKGLMSLIQAERINGVYFNVVVARYFLKHTLFNKNAIVFDSTLPHSRNHYYVSTIRHGDVVDQINEFLETEAALVSSLKDKYEVRL